MEIIGFALSIVELLFDIGGARRRQRRPSSPVRVGILLAAIIGFFLLCGLCLLIGALTPGNR